MSMHGCNARPCVIFWTSLYSTWDSRNQTFSYPIKISNLNPLFNLGIKKSNILQTKFESIVRPATQEILQTKVLTSSLWFDFRLKELYLWKELLTTDSKNTPSFPHYTTTLSKITASFKDVPLSESVIVKVTLIENWTCATKLSREIVT